MDHICLLVWNTEWARPIQRRGRLLQDCFKEVDPDVICVTEGYAELLPRSGHVIESSPSYGYPVREGRRKVLLWSREHWSDVDALGHSHLPPGRFVSGATKTPLGRLQVFGVCIPWRDAHVRTGQRNRRAWEDHRAYLRGLAHLLSHRKQGLPAIVAGDFNQRVPRVRTPVRIYEDLISTFDGNFTVCTGGEIQGVGDLSIDHVAHTSSVRCRDRWGIPKISETGVKLSDHFGVVALLERE